MKKVTGISLFPLKVSDFGNVQLQILLSTATKILNPRCPATSSIFYMRNQEKEKMVL